MPILQAVYHIVDLWNTIFFYCSRRQTAVKVT